MALAVSGAAKEDLVVSLAILALHDGGVEVSSENIAALISSTGNTVAPYWAPLYAKLLSGKNIDELLMKPGAGGGAAPAAAAGAAAAGGAAAAKKEEKKKEEEPEEEVGGAGGLFGGEDDDW